MFRMSFLGLELAVHPPVFFVMFYTGNMNLANPDVFLRFLSLTSSQTDVPFGVKSQFFFLTPGTLHQSFRQDGTLPVISRGP